MSSKVLAGRYEIIEKIGDGGMAVVYKARDKLLNRFVAVKILRPEFIKDSLFLENFKRESKAAASLLHPNIVTIYDVGKDGDVNYIVMEYVEGCTLSDLIAKEAPLDYKRSINIAKQIASALSLAHRNNIIHRDVKPHNILITTDGTAKITDFGIAKAVSDGTVISENGVIMGSVHYFSPEQSRGQYVDEKSDIYSLGIVIYEMLTGRVPFDADNPVTIAVMHMNDSIIPPSRLVKGVPPGLDQIVLKATAKFQSDRFKSMDEMFKALDNVNFITGIIEDPEIAGYVAPTSTGLDSDYDSNGMPANYDEDYEDDSEDGYDDNYDTDDYDEDDDDDEDDYVNIKDKKKKAKKKQLGKKYRVLAIFLGILAAIIASFFLFQGINWLLTDANVELPNVVGMPEAEATAELVKARFKVDVSYSNTPTEEVENAPEAATPIDMNGDPIEVGEVLTQDPPGGGGVHVAKGSTIKLVIYTIAEPPDPFTGEVPDLKGKSKADAEYAITAAGFTKGNVRYEDSSHPADEVIAQIPEAGSPAEKGSPVNITVSKGGKSGTAVVPKLVGLTLDEAKSLLYDLELEVGTVSEDYTTEFKAGLIMSQEFPEGDEISVGHSVAVTISQGPSPETPRTLNIKIDFTNAPGDTFGLTVKFVDIQGDEEVLINAQQTQKSQGSTTVAVTGPGNSNGTLNVYFNNDLSASYNVDFATGAVASL